MKEFSEVLAKELTEKLAWFEIKELSENWSFKVVASDETVDRAWEVIKVAWRELNNYMKNPIILFWHKYNTLTDIVGKATAVYTEGTSLIVEWVFASTEPAQMLRQLYDDGIIKTVSVGFIPKERDPEDRKIITRAELLELSFVPVPCNPNALSLWKEIMEDLVSKWILVKENEEAPVEEEAPTEEVEGETVEGEDVEGHQEKAFDAHQFHIKTCVTGYWRETPWDNQSLFGGHHDGIWRKRNVEHYRRQWRRCRRRSEKTRRQL